MNYLGASGIGPGWWTSPPRPGSELDLPAPGSTPSAGFPPPGPVTGIRNERLVESLGPSPCVRLRGECLTQDRTAYQASGVRAGLGLGLGSPVSQPVGVFFPFYAAQCEILLGPAVTMLSLSFWNMHRHPESQKQSVPSSVGRGWLTGQLGSLLPTEWYSVQDPANGNNNNSNNNNIVIVLMAATTVLILCRCFA